MRHGFYVAILAGALMQTAPAPDPVALAQTIDLLQVEGRIDHLALDVARQQMFVAALGNNTVEVLDLAKGVRGRSLPGSTSRRASSCCRIRILSRSRTDNRATSCCSTRVTVQ